MLKVLCFIFLLCVYLSEAFNPEICQSKPKEKHCLIEWSVRDRWPHKVRYVYDYATRTCFEIRWSDHCPPVPSPITSNNFPTAQECLQTCGGWN